MLLLAWLHQRHALCLWRRNSNERSGLHRLMYGGAGACPYIKYEIKNPPQ
jgi:hypothetical protein